jgi:alcohol dehydrogenase class IV
LKNFNYFQPTEIIFGIGRLDELKQIARRFGKRCLLVTTPAFPAIEPMYDRVKQLLTDIGISVAHFDQVQPNPTTENISAGAEMAREHKAEMIIGLGGGSSMDSAKAIAVEATHEGTSWDYLFYRNTQPTEKTLPIIAVSTTSGTGSQVTQVAVVTNSKERDKSAIYHPLVFPRICIIDPELMVTVPEHITASTGFDVFCHAFESMLHPAASAYTDMLAHKAIELVIKTLPSLLTRLDDVPGRENMALADTLAGLCIANAGVTLPHGIGMAIGGMYPHVMHGESLALNYPVFSRFTYTSAKAQFAEVGRIFSPALKDKPDEAAAEQACHSIDEFLKNIGMWFGFEHFNIPEAELNELAQQSLVLPDYKNNPRIATLEETEDLLRQCISR